VRELMNAEQIVSRVQPSIEVAAKIRAVVPPGTPVAAAHSAWLPKAVGDAETLPGFPRHDADVTCPPGILLVEVDCIGRRSGGMSSQFGYEGYFLSMLVLIDERKVWDARGAAAS
jgi:hypothetical protein